MTQNYIKSLSEELDSVFNKFGDRTCIYDEVNGNTTYNELEILVQKFMNVFFEKGVSAQEIVVIRAGKTKYSYASALACLKYGAVFCFIDPKIPNKRLAEILRMLSPKLILQEEFENRIYYSGEIVPIDKAIQNIYSFSPNLTSTFVGPSDAAYIVFTSGSTGTPKGVTISRHNLKLFISWAKKEYGLAQSDIHTHINPIYFDNSIFDIFTTFFSGASIVPFPDEDCKDPYKIVDKIKKYSCNVLFCVPSMLRFIVNMRAVDSDQLCSLDRIIFGGEGYPIPELAKLFELVGSHSKLFNVYGPSECTCICSNYQITQEDLRQGTGFPAIGEVTENFDFYILDSNGQPVGYDVAGELYLGGPCVGLGYFNDRERTEEKFQFLSDRHNFMNKVYATGDLFKISLKDKKLYFIGRKDFQIKKQGYRIELEEIENVAVMNEFIIEACCCYDEDKKSLILVVEKRDGAVLREIKAHLKEHLPSYMLPDDIKTISKMRKNANGKTDRKALKLICSDLEKLN